MIGNEITLIGQKKKLLIQGTKLIDGKDLIKAIVAVIQNQLAQTTTRKNNKMKVRVQRLHEMPNSLCEHITHGFVFLPSTTRRHPKAD